jgi:iron(III) transport system ATP-binding protein
MAVVELEALTKFFGTAAAVDDLTLTVAHGSLCCLLGPSGCGKTTTLRLVAGFIDPDRGTIRVGGRVVSQPGRNLPPERRRMSMIFQSYALWPHMTVAENVGYGLKLRRLDRAECGRRIAAILDVAHLAELAGRYPHELSGGQRWPARSSSSRKPCCSTSRSPISTPICARRCGSRSAACTTPINTRRSM